MAWAVWAVKLICELLVEKSCLAFFKICLKIHFYTSNVQISFTAQTAPPKFSLPPRRGLKLVWSGRFTNFWLTMSLGGKMEGLDMYGGAEKTYFFGETTRILILHHFSNAYFIDAQ